MTVAELKKYKENLYGSKSRDLAEFEKNFLLIAIGILAFSITFIKEIVKIEVAVSLWILFLSWFIIITSIGIMIYTFFRSYIASDKLWSIVDTFIIENKLLKNELELTDNQAYEIKVKTNNVLYKNKRILKNLRLASVISFLIGISLLAMFVSINLSNENKKKDSQSVVNNVIINNLELNLCTNLRNYILL